MANTPNGRNNGIKRRCGSEDESDCSDCIQLTPLEEIISPSTSRSPGSTGKYYSPTKKRYVNRRQPFKKRLDMDSVCPIEDKVLKEACANIDDKSIFLLKVIHKYLSNESLKNLLDGATQEILSNCFKAVKPGIVIICRMYWRKTLWYRYDDVVKILKENYKKFDTPTVQEMIQYLVQNGLLTCGGAEWSIDNYGEVMKVDELKKICKDLKIKYINKEKALQSLKMHRHITIFFKKETNNINKNQIVCNKMRQLCGDFYSLSSSARTALHKLYVLMYLGTDYSWIRENKLELVLLNDKAKIETYPVDKNMKLDDASDVFSSKHVFEKYYNALTLYEEFLALSSDEEKYTIVLQVYDMYKNISDVDMACYISYPEWLHKYTPPHIYIKILDSGIQTLKRLKHNETALEVLSTLIAQVAFRQHMKAEWYAEKALIYKNLGKHKLAAEVLMVGFQSNLPKDTKDVMRNRAKNIANMKKSDIDQDLRAKLLAAASDGHILENSFTAEHIDMQPMENTGKGKIKFYIRSENSTSVMDAEDYCLRQYIQSGRFTDGGHWEGRLVTTIFYLLFWDIIYTKPRGVTGIFLSYFQKYPLDIYTDSFYINRKTLIMDRLKTIENYTEEELLKALEEKWEERPPHEVSEVHRSHAGITLAAVLGAGAALGAAPGGAPGGAPVGAPGGAPGGARARALCALCARLAARPGARARGFPDLTLWHTHTKQIIFVEVKTDSDTPSVKQLQWMDYLNKHGMHAEFCYVGAKTTRRKARAGNE